MKPTKPGEIDCSQSPLKPSFHDLAETISQVGIGGDRASDFHQTTSNGPKLTQKKETHSAPTRSHRVDLVRDG